MGAVIVKRVRGGSTSLCVAPGVVLGGLAAPVGASAGLLAGVLALFVLSAPAQAANIPVTNTEDDGAGSLRAAIEAANVAANPDIVDATGVSGTINLQSALSTLSQEVEIRGPGAAALTVRRDAAAATDFRIFRVSSTAEISGLTIANGRNDDQNVGGAGILNDQSTLTLRDSVVTGNVNVAISNGADGGGIVNRSLAANTATLTIVDSSVSGNTSAGNGGGILNGNNSTVTVRRSTVRGNTSLDGAGCVGGGGIRNQGALTVANSTVTGNSAPDAIGGGILGCSASPSSTSVVNSTIASNSASSGVNLDVLGDADDTADVRSTILSDPKGGGTNCDVQAPATLTSNGFNLASDASCNLAATTDQPSTNPNLGPLADNGGPTRTMALLSGSPAIDKGIGNGLTSDQRGLTRPVDFPAIPNAPGGDGSDIGAFEVQALPLPPPPPPEPSNEFSFGKVKKNKRKGTAKLIVNVPGPGELELAKTKKVKGKEKRANAAGKTKLRVKPKGKAKRKLGDKGKAKVKAEVTYSPDGGDPNTKSRRVKLARRR